MLDYIVVGQGIAGSLVSYFLLKNKKKIVVIDNNNPGSSSRVAAGIFNPITGKRKVKTWQADLLFNYLNSFYPKLEEELKSSFFTTKPVYMLFDSLEEQNHWAGKLADKEYKDILDINTSASVFSDFINDKFGGLLAKISGYIDLSQMLSSMKEYATSFDAYDESQFLYENLRIEEEKIYYKNYVAKRIIFCEGSRISVNPYFSWLPFNLVKGELLMLKVEEIPDIIFNKNIFILPLDGQTCIAGATYNWDDISDNTTQSAKEELIVKINQLIKVKYEVIGQRAGIRPATQDRRPFLGPHPQFKNMFVFGGLGTKGVSIAPYYADHFYHYLENGKELDKDVNINRHYSLYYLNK